MLGKESNSSLQCIGEDHMGWGKEEKSLSYGEGAENHPVTRPLRLLLKIRITEEAPHLILAFCQLILFLEQALRTVGGHHLVVSSLGLALVVCRYRVHQFCCLVSPLKRTLILLDQCPPPL